jgi:hypothetical protein
MKCGWKKTATYMNINDMNGVIYNWILIEGTAESGELKAIGNQQSAITVPYFRSCGGALL